MRFNFTPLLFAAFALVASPLRAAEIVVMNSGGFAAAYNELAPKYEALSGDKLKAVYGSSLGTTATAIPVRLKNGEPADVLIMVRAALDGLAARGEVIAGSQTDLARSPIAMAVRKGAPVPDISTMERFKQVLLAAKAVAYSDSASGIYIETQMFRDMGIEAQMKGKARMIPAEPVGLVVARGEADIGFQQLSELIPVPGITVVGPIPYPAQRITAFGAGIATRSTNPEAAKRLIAYLAGPQAADAIRRSGIEPAGPASAGQAVSLNDRCAALAKLIIPAANLSLPSGGAKITEAVSVVAGERNGDYCKVMGAVSPIDPTAPDIRFQINLPADWNKKALQMGGGGYNGRIPNTLGPASHGSRTGPTPLGMGYMTLASDSGHQSANGDDAAFGMNDEALANFGGLHIKKTHDVAVAVAQAFYGSEPRRFYFAGGSTGGREALTAAERWPEAYDGVISNYPTANFLGLRLWGAALASSIYPDQSAGWIAPALVKRIADSAREDCDPMDGVKDGLVSNMVACRAGSAARLQKWACRTPGQADCLTPVQIARTIKTYHDGYSVKWTAKDGLNGFGGYNSLEGVEMNLGTQKTYTNPPVSGPAAHHADRAAQFAKFFVARDPDFDLLDLDVQNPGKWLPRLQAISRLVGATSTDWSAFEQRGGKVLLMQGQDDASVSPIENTKTYTRVVARMGQQRVDRFVRFYLVPGQGHGIGDFQLSWDNLQILDAWADKGVSPPVAPVGVDNNRATVGRERPVCRFPTYPRYTGAGSVDRASSYRCVAS